MRPRLAQILLGITSVLAFASISMGEKNSVLADKHKAQGLVCADCHGTGPKRAVPMQQCLMCHDSYAKVAERTKSIEPNPHDNHLIDLECSKCHLGHNSQSNYCLTCHKELEFKKS